jgi:hypothetical protein
MNLKWNYLTTNETSGAESPDKFGRETSGLEIKKSIVLTRGIVVGCRGNFEFGPFAARDVK